jgi:hypothetical protein
VTVFAGAAEMHPLAEETASFVQPPQRNESKPWSSMSDVSPTCQRGGGGAPAHLTEKTLRTAAEPTERLMNRRVDHGGQPLRRAVRSRSSLERKPHDGRLTGPDRELEAGCGVASIPLREGRGLADAVSPRALEEIIKILGMTGARHLDSSKNSALSVPATGTSNVTSLL